MNDKRSDSEFEFCPFCGNKLTDRTANICPHCEREIRVTSVTAENGPGHFEYKSRLTLFGWPLIHVIGGSQSGKRKPLVARGFIAVGEIAVGGIAVGGLALGGIAVGGCSAGMVTLSGVSLGLILALGGLSISGGFAAGGLAIGSVAVGGLAVGYYAFGGLALGPIVEGGNRQDAAARVFRESWLIQAELIISFLRPVIIFFVLAPFLLIPFIRKPTDNENDSRSTTPDRPDPFESELPENRLEKGFPNDSADRFGPQSNNATKQRQQGSIVGLIIFILVGGIIGICGVWLLLLTIGALA